MHRLSKTTAILMTVQMIIIIMESSPPSFEIEAAEDDVLVGGFVIVLESAWQLNFVPSEVNLESTEVQFGSSTLAKLRTVGVVMPPLSLDPPPRLESVAQVVGESLYFPMGHLVQMTSSPLKTVEVAAVHVRVADPADMW